MLDRSSNPTSARRPARRWFRFSLRTFLLSIAAVGILLGWFGRKLHSAHQQADIVAALRAGGVMVSYDYQDELIADPPEAPWLISLLGVDFFHEVHSVLLFRESIHGPADTLSNLCRLKHLQSATLVRADIRDADLGRLVELGRLTTLGISDNPFSAEGLRQVGRMVQLERLNLSCNELTDEGIQHLENLSELRSLNLAETKVSARALAGLCKLSKLDSIVLVNNRMNGDGLRSLALFPSLKSVVVNNAEINDESLQHLAGAQGLRDISLDGNPITDAGLEVLKNLPLLAQVKLGDTQVTLEGIKRLQLAKPNLRIWLEEEKTPAGDSSPRSPDSDQPAASP